MLGSRASQRASGKLSDYRGAVLVELELWSVMGLSDTTEVFRKVEGCVKLQVEVQSTMTTNAEHVHCSINVISGHG